MKPSPAPPGFTEFVLTHSHDLFRTAVAMTRDAHAAEDLVQIALARAWRKWSQIEGEPRAYVRTIVVREFLRTKKRRWSGEVPTDPLPQTEVVSDPSDRVVQNVTLADGIAALPSRQRAVIVLRYLDDLTEAQTADALGVAVGTVKSQHAKALAALKVSDQLTDEPNTDHLAEGSR